MVSKTIELMLEYISFILCIYKISKKTIKINVWMILPFFMEWIYVLGSTEVIIPIGYKIIIFCGLFLYTRIKVVDTWNKTINVCGMMLIVVMALQLFQFYIFKFFSQRLFITPYEEIIANINICLLIVLWKEKYSSAIIKKLNEIKGVIIAVVFLLVLVRILYLFSQNSFIDFEIAIQFLAETVGLSVACILWFSAENEKNHKAREVQMYELYNRAFEETIMTIRTRQHEFENHINAIKCLQYTIVNHEELLLEQERYCEKILQENKLNGLLKLNLEPVLIGFLYSKIKTAEEKGIETKYELQPIDIKDAITIYEFIELIGILFDNAVEALEERESKIIILKLLVEDGKAFSLEIANISPFYSNNEIEKFCSYGYSTKGEKRGIGLQRVKEITQKYNVIYHIQNCTYNGNNYLSFKLSFNQA